MITFDNEQLKQLFKMKEFIRKLVIKQQEVDEIFVKNYIFLFSLLFHSDHCFIVKEILIKSLLLDISSVSSAPGLAAMIGFVFDNDLLDETQFSPDILYSASLIDSKFYGIIGGIYCLKSDKINSMLKILEEKFLDYFEKLATFDETYWHNDELKALFDGFKNNVHGNDVSFVFQFLKKVLKILENQFEPTEHLNAEFLYSQNNEEMDVYGNLEDLVEINPKNNIISGKWDGIGNHNELNDNQIDSSNTHSINILQNSKLLGVDQELDQMNNSKNDSTVHLRKEDAQKEEMNSDILQMPNNAEYDELIIDEMEHEDMEEEHNVSNNQEMGYLGQEQSQYDELNLEEVNVVMNVNKRFDIQIPKMVNENVIKQFHKLILNQFFLNLQKTRVEYPAGQFKDKTENILKQLQSFLSISKLS